jgi:LysR family transcriptional regulator, benzoate and cis,cis-muconate-responsive activator of ben and cat genes
LLARIGDVEGRGVELRHIRCFIAVAECVNFHMASQRLHIAQPPLSRQIRQLEESLGVELFARDKRRVELYSRARLLVWFMAL